jgi:DNA-binding transcriptional LysR family regulator
MTGRRPRPHVTLDQLHTFLAVAEREHVTGAAHRLGMSQGSVSSQVHRLERVLGVPLLHRVGRNVRLTDVGRGVRQLAVRTLEFAAQIEQLATGYLAFETGEISVAAGPVMGTHRLSGWLAPFVERHPDIEIRITLAPMQALLAMLANGDADVAFMGLAVAAAQHPLARSAGPVRDLARHRHLAHERGTATQIRAARVLGQRAEGARTIELEEGALMAALHAGLGFAVMPRAVVEGDIAAGRLVVLLLPGRRVSQAFVAASRTGLRTPAAQALWLHLGETRGSH